MVINGDVVILNEKEIEKLIDSECQKRLGISGKEFIEKLSREELPNSNAVNDIKMLLKIAQK